jgi:transcriptional regulator with PAS, ATPase and Fis domain
MSPSEVSGLADFLSTVSFFSEVSKESLINFSKYLDFESFRKNETIFEKGELGNAMYVIFEGEVKVHDQDHIYDSLAKGECFGEYALIDNQKRSATITANTSTKVLKVEREHFLNLMKTDSGFSQGILTELIKRHRELDTIQERLASSKLDLELANSKMNGLIQGAMDAIIMFDSNFRIVLTNPSANILLENNDVLKRNVLYFFDDAGATFIEDIVADEKRNNNFIPDIIKVIGSNDKETLNEGTISSFNFIGGTFHTLILRDIEERLKAENKIELLTQQTEYLSKEIKALTSDYGIIAEDIKMKQVLNLIEQVAKTDATVLINGETGTGKELVARAIHRSSNRNDKPLIRINCGAIPTNLIESELFGHKKGAFTGATADRKGRFLLADKGTIFLDEIGELPIELQPKLLRVIQEGEFDPVGSSDTIKVDVRIIAATHRDLLERAKKGEFREDLFYRLNVFPIEVPPLRDRGNDVSIIAQEMVSHFSNKLGKPSIQLQEEDTSILSSYEWPGNVRELQNLVERAVIISKNESINWSVIIPNNSNSKTTNPVNETKILTSKELIQLEKENILKALKQTKWKISGANGAAEILQLKPTTLTSKIKVLGIERPI